MSTPQATNMTTRRRLMSDVQRTRLKIVLRLSHAQRLAKKAGVSNETTLPVRLQRILDLWHDGTMPSNDEMYDLISYADRLNARSQAYREEERARKKAEKYRGLLKSQEASTLTTTTAKSELHKPITTESPDILIGRSLRAVRLERKLSQGQVGKRAGLSLSQVHKYENGKTRAEIGVLLRLCTALDMSLSTLIEQAELSTAIHAR